MHVHVCAHGVPYNEHYAHASCACTEQQIVTLHLQPTTACQHADTLRIAGRARGGGASISWYVYGLDSLADLSQLQSSHYADTATTCSGLN